MSNQHPALLVEMRRHAALFFTGFLWLNLPLLCLAAWASGSSVTAVAVLGGLGAGIVTLAWRHDATAPLTRYLIAAFVMTDFELWVYVASPTSYIIEGHFSFFLFLSMLVALVCWGAIIIASLHAALHHLILNIFIPSWLFPDGTDWWRFLIHAAVVVIQAGFALWIVVKLTTLFEKMQLSIGELQERGHEVDVLSRQRDEQREANLRQQREALGELADSFKATVQGVVQHVAETARKVHADAEGMLKTVADSESQTESAMAASRAASTSVSAVAGATAELVDSIRQVSSRVEEAVAASGRAADSVEGTRTIAGNLAGTADRIGDVVNLITSIASQTNLLALNATIEAARAGEAGKGFAVVANEVKALANQTAKATQDITAQIAAIQQDTGRVVDAVQVFGAVIADINRISNAIAETLHRQEGVSRDIGSNVRQAAEAAEAAAGRLDVVVAAGERTRGASGNVLASADALAMMSDNMQDALERFVSHLRTRNVSA